MGPKTEKKVRCPKCGMELLEFTFQGIRIDQCAQCEGVWLDPGELTRIVRARHDHPLSLELAEKQAWAEERLRALEPEEAERLRQLHHLRCPRCEGLLEEIPYRDLQIDRCAQCRGIWLDAGELDQVSGAERGIFKTLSRLLHGE